MLMATVLLGVALMAAAPVPATTTQLPPTPRFRHYGVSEGLPSSRVYATVQDKDGFLWIATGDGLARFDGQHFRIYRHDSRDPGSLPANDISAILIDSQNRLWVGGEATGLNRLRADGEGFRHWMHAKGNPDSLSGNDIMGLAEDADGRIWVGVFGGGVNRLRADGSGFDRWRHVEGDAATLASDNIVSMHADDSGRVWAGSNRGLDVILPDGTVQHVPFAGDKRPWVWQIQGRAGDLLLSTTMGLFHVGADGVAQPWPAEQPVKHTVLAALREPGKPVWVARVGQLIMETGDGRRDIFSARENLPGGLSARYLNNIMRDREGGLWFSSVYSGLLYLRPDWRDFSRFAHVPDDDSSLRSNKAMALAVDADGQVLVGGLDGTLDRLDPETGKAEPVAISGKLPGGQILAIAVDTSRIWLSMKGALWSLEDGVLHQLENALIPGGSRDLLVLPDHSLLAAPVSGSIVRIQPDLETVTAVTTAFNSDGDSMIYQLMWVGEEVWCASVDGLSSWVPGDAAFKPAAGVEPGHINAFAVRGQTLWLARPDRLERYQLDGDGASLVATAGRDQGFPEISINRMFIDGDGRVWLTSRVGLWRHDPGSGGFRRYGVEDGLPDPEFTYGLARLGDGRVFAGTLNGVVAFQPLLLRDHDRMPAVVRGGISVLRDADRTPLAPEGGTVHLRWDDNNLRVAVQAISFVQPQGNQYRWRMDGFDSDWVPTGSEGAREFPGLPAGQYTLKIEAAVAGGAWTPARSLRVRVDPPPWVRPWAWMLYAALGLLLVFIAWRMLRARVQRRMELRLLERQRRLAEEANEAKTRFLATMGHEIRTPMTGVLGMAELLSHSRLDGRQADMVRAIHRSGEVLLKLVNEALDMARIEAGRLELENQPLDPVALMQDVVALERGVAEAKGIGIEIVHAEDVPARVEGDAVRLRQILMNLLGNALKFSQTGTVRLSLDMDGAKLRYRVRDNGPGMDAELQRRLFRRFEQGRTSSDGSGSGLGLAICRELTQLMDGQISVQSEPGEGSTFTVVLPLPACDAAAAAPAESEDGSAGKQAHKVLLVEDEATVAEVIKGLLSQAGHAVQHVPDALAALSEIEQGGFDAVLVDIDLPDVNGFELVRMLRAGSDGPALRIIVVTARSERDDEQRAEEAGADGFLRKPVSGRQLQAALDAE